MHKEIGDLLIGGALCEGEPVAGRLVVQTQQYPAKRAQVFRDRDQMIVRDMRIDRQRQRDILPVCADIRHLPEDRAVP